MGNSKKIEEMIARIETSKEVLSTMPKNNEKNKAKYKAKIEELQKEYQKYQEDIIEIFNKRYQEAINIQKNKEIETLESRLKTIDGALYLLNEEMTSYEKLEMDKNIYKLSRYYKENLENVNNQILVCIKQFHQIGIDLTLQDFDYTNYVNEYMATFFTEVDKGNINSDKIKAKFEEIYWKCPDIIMHIELNLRNIYLRKQQAIDKYFEKEKNELLKKWNKKPEEILNAYLDLKKQRLEKIAIDKKILMDRFISGELNTKNFTNDKIKANCQKILPKFMIDKMEDEEEVQINILKFLNSLYEYKNYIDFKFIIDDVKKYYKEKENYKKSYADTKKKIDTAEKKLKKINKKSSSKGLFGGKKDNTKQTAEQNQLIQEIRGLYKELDLNKFYNKIYLDLTDNSTVYDVLNLASSYYEYLTSCMIKNNKAITQEEMDYQIEKLKEFLKNPYNTIINNITILEEKDIALIIKDRYKLLNFIVEKADLESVDSLISTLEEIEIGINLKKAGLKIEDIEKLCELKKILKIK